MSNISNITCNYFNIRTSDVFTWIGQIGSYKGFVKFSSCEFGVRAFLLLLYNYRSKHNIHTVQSFVERYAPASDNNNVSAYVRFIVDNYGSEALPLTFNELISFIRVVVKYETSVSLSENFVRAYLLDSVVNNSLKKYLRYVQRFKRNFTSVP